MTIRGNNLSFVSLGHVRAGFVERALRGLVGLDAGMDIANQMFLAAHADPAMVARLIAEGISLLDMGLDISEVEANQHIEAQPRSMSETLGAAIRNALSARIHDDFDEADLDRLATANVRLVLNFRNNAQLDKIQSLTELATQVIEEDDEFKIRTTKGNDYSRDQLLVRGHYTQPQAIAYLNHNLAWTQGLAFLDSLQ
ncbi:hypothetical protein [Kaistia algarum]|uniref:hypothetical protein n=1 Tax=Kaistia algarum TaxID=2083279 RepID=UPI00105730F8|nr:hypothetical protein [Kaistia algarum]MCX5512165.1 hypothetical protein [Kaistia algarum]